ncbi:MAG: rhamnan synthesis F family protein, partial [Candidatus Muiribacteriota bacterium]
MKRLLKKIIPAKIWVLLSIIKNNPAYVKKVISTIKNSGFHKAVDKTRNKLDTNNLSELDKNPTEIKTEDTYILSNPVDTDNSLSIAITVHVYYMDRLEQIMGYIKNIPYKHTLYFTVCEESESKLNHILNKYSLADYKIIVVENSGYDIFPFLKLLPVLTEQKHDLVCKIHTKKGAANLEKHISGIDDVWFKILMDSVLGSTDLIKKIAFAFKSDTDLGMIGPASLYKSAQKLMYGNETYTTDILNKISYNTDPAKDWGFFAGSMFWARLEVFKPIIKNQKLDDLLNDSLDMKTGQYASAFHGMERVFGKLPFLVSMKTGLTYHLDIENKSNAIEIFDTEKKYSPVGVGMTLQNEYELEKNYRILKNHPSFDKNFYLENSATCQKLNMDPLLYFLRYGVYQNEMPNENLSPFTFWSVNKKYLINRINPLIALSGKSNIQDPVINMPENINLIMGYIKKSGFFDKNYYSNNNADVAKNIINPLYHYCKTGFKETRIPGPEFDSFWYESEYLNQCITPVNPLLHYVLAGKKKGCKPKPPYKKTGLISQKIKKHPKRITLFAAYDPDGIIDESVLIFVKELSKYSDVYFLSDSNIQNSELKKIEPFVESAWGLRHEEYDFGSYMRMAKYFVGWDKIEQYDELLLVNDSSYLISSLGPVFNKMDKKNISWWGMQATKG